MQNGTVRVNSKAAVACVISLVVCVYLIYSWASARSSMKSGTYHRRLDTWKKHDFVDVPQGIKELSENIKVTEDIVKVVMDDTTLNIFYRTATGTAQVSKSPVVILLHGAGSSSKVWSDLRTMHLIAAMGHGAIAVDLPGWAKSKDAELTALQRKHFLPTLFKALRVDRPLLITASMSGSYVLPYMMLPEPESCNDRVSAFVPLAPVATQRFTHAQYHRCEIPTMIVYGTKDKQLGLQSVGNLRNMPNSEIMPMEGAGHANYEERPDEWHRLLYNFLLAVEEKKQ